MRKIDEIYRVLEENKWSIAPNRQRTYVVLKFFDADNNIIAETIKVEINSGQNAIADSSFQNLVHIAHFLEIYEQEQYLGRIALKSTG